MIEKIPLTFVDYVCGAHSSLAEQTGRWISAEGSAG